MESKTKDKEARSPASLRVYERTLNFAGTIRDSKARSLESRRNRS